jgi:hypothetical protein
MRTGRTPPVPGHGLRSGTAAGTADSASSRAFTPITFEAVDRYLKERECDVISNQKYTSATSVMLPHFLVAGLKNVRCRLRFSRGMGGTHNGLWANKNINTDMNDT